MEKSERRAAWQNIKEEWEDEYRIGAAEEHEMKSAKA